MNSQSISHTHAHYLKNVKQLIHHLDLKEVDDGELASIQMQLDKLSQRYQNDESIGADRYRLYQAQAMIHYWRNDDSQAVDWMQEAINVKGSSFELADNFLAHVHKPEEYRQPTKVNRLNRKSYLVSLLSAYSLLIVAYLLDITLYSITNTEFESNKYGMPFLLVTAVITTIYSIYIGVRRLHDINKSGWEILIAMIPLLGLVIALPMLFKKGTEVSNKYGNPIEGLVILGVSSGRERIAHGHRFKEPTNENAIATQLPWKFLPIVLILLFIPAIPSILTRHTTREAAKDSQVQQSQADVEYRKTLISTIVAGSPDLSQKDAECVVDVLIEAHTLSGVRQMISSQPAQSPYTHAVKTELISRCEVNV